MTSGKRRSTSSRDHQAILEQIRAFRDQRDWMQFHDPKNMAISIVLEAAELLEHFQWKNEQEVMEHVRAHKREIADEIADVALYLFELADNLGIDLLRAMRCKLKKNAWKYPIRKARGRHAKYHEL